MIRASVKIGGSRLSENDFSSLSLNQKIGAHHTFEIHILQSAKKDFLLEKAKLWIGEDVILGIDHHNEIDVESMPIKEVFKGIVTSIELSRKKDSSDIVVKGHSPTIIIDNGPQTKNYNDAGLEEIIDASLKNCQLPENPVIKPKLFKSALEYIVQYKESPFRFIKRLSNRYGEWFYYDGMKLYFGLPDERKTVDLDFAENGLVNFEIVAQATPTRYDFHAFNYLHGDDSSVGSPLSIPTNDLGNTILNKSTEKIFSGRSYLYPNSNMDKTDVEHLVYRKTIDSASNMVSVQGQSTNCRLQIGANIVIQDKAIGENFGKYIVTELYHIIGQNGDYKNRFEAYPAELESPPIKNPVDAPFCETQQGLVIDTNDPEGIGRVRVKLITQLARSEPTPWIRVVSPYAGQERGFYAVPEVNDMVLVAFEANDPEKPYVLSSLYDGDIYTPEMFDSENRYKGFRTVGNNKLRFDDKHKNVLLSAPNEMTLYAGNKITLKTKGEEDGEIHVNVGEGTVSIVAKHVNVESAQTVSISSGENLTIQSGADTEMSTGTNMNITAGDDYTLDVGKNLNQTVGTAVKIEAKKVALKADVTAEITGSDVSVKSKGKISVKSASLMQLKGAPVNIN